MKRFLSLLFTTLLLTVALCVTASASDFDAVAEDLSTIGMFRGTANGFELDRAPTRSEAAIMLVRLYGAEEAAKTAYEAGEISHPFTDVSDFTSPYVAWLYTNGITNGFTDTTFASQRPCSAQNYATFLLRALGYKDGTDFAYADALTFAQEKGFYDPVMFSGEFLRDDLAALTYQGLAADTADGETYLLDKLVESGAIDASAAKPLTEKMELYHKMHEVAFDADASAHDMQVDLIVKMDMTDGTESAQSTMRSTANIKTIVSGTDAQMAYLTTISQDGVSQETNSWMKDSWVYSETNYGSTPVRIKYYEKNQMDVLEKTQVDIGDLVVSDLAVIRSIASKRSGSDTIYTMVINSKMGGAFTDISPFIGTDNILSLEIGDMMYICTANQNGNLKSIQALLTADATIGTKLEDGTTYTVDAHYDYDMTFKVNATGNNVTITWPDFSDFVEIDPSSKPIEAPLA